MSGLKIFCLVAPNGKSAYLDLVNGKLVHGGDLPTDEAAEIFMKEMAKSLQKLQERQVLQMQRDALRTALEEAIEYLEPRVEGGKVGVNLLPRLKAVIASVEGGEPPTNYDGWISVLDRMPERFLQVLVTVEEDGERFVEIDAYQVNDWCSPSNGRKVTHWRPLPEPAAEQKGGAV